VTEQVVELNPGESKVVSFEAIPSVAKTYQVAVDGLEGSFVAKAAPMPWEYGQPSCRVAGSSFPWVWQVRFECLITNPGSVTTSKEIFLMVDLSKGWVSFGPYPGVLGPSESWPFVLLEDTVLVSDLNVIAAGIPCYLRDSDGAESPHCIAR